MNTRTIFIGTIGTFRVEIPVIEIGSGEPKGLIVAVQHGGELSPLWIIKELINAPPRSGAMTLIPVANPFGFVFGERNEVIEQKDPNRQYPGRASGDFSARIADKIFSLAKEADFVVDLHTFTRQAPFLVGYERGGISDGNDVEKLIQLLGPDVVWTVDEKQGEDRRFAGSFDGALGREGVPSVFIEMPNYQMISQDLIVRIASGIRNVFEGYSSPFQKGKEIKRFSAKYLYADDAGIFDPTVKPLETVVAGQEIGTLYLLPNFKKQKVITPIGGTVLTVKGKDVIRTGTKLASIGV